MTGLASLCVATAALAAKLAPTPTLARKRRRSADHLRPGSAPMACLAKERGSGVAHGRGRLAAPSTALLVDVWALCLSLGRLISSRASPRRIYFVPPRSQGEEGSAVGAGEGRGLGARLNAS